MSLRFAFVSPEHKRRHVRRLFQTIAARYDLITVVLSAGRDRAWKQRLVSLARPMPGERTLDLACGTGDLTFALADAGARVTGLDVTPGMLALARRKRADIEVILGDMTDLPLRSETFDLVTVGYGIRNVPRIEPALREIRRVLRPSGRLLSLDFDRPAHPVARGVYLGYLRLAGGALGWLLHRDPETYRYIPASIERYPGASGLDRALQSCGFRFVGHQPLLGGLMAINYATK